MPRLTIEDVNRLVDDAASPAARAGTAAKLAQEFNAADFSPSEVKLAEDIFRIMVRDAEVRVREALALNLKSNPRVPRDIAVTLARDVEAVALPILQFSEVLTTADLVAIVESHASNTKMEAIAGRDQVDESLSAALVERGSEQVVATLLGNAGASIAEPSLHRAVDRFGDSQAVQAPLAHRATLPVTVTERLISRVAEDLRSYLLSRHEISADVAVELVLHSRERATVGMAMGVTDDALAALVTQLATSGRLTGSLVLRAICMGNLGFFEHALATLGMVPVRNARMLVHEASGAGLRAIWTKARLPESMLPAIRAAVAVVDQTELDTGRGAMERYSRRILERVLTQYETFGVEFAGDDLEYLLARVSQLPPAFAVATAH